MTRVIVSQEARRDLMKIRNYIRDELCNPAAAKRIIHELRTAIQGLRNFANRGRPLDTMIPIHTEYRYLPCENYCIFYLVREEEVFIIRILHQKQDTLKALFMDPDTAFPADDPWMSTRQAIGTSSDDFMEERKQPSWNEVTPKEKL